VLGTVLEVSQDVALDTLSSLHNCALFLTCVPVWYFINDTAGIPRLL